MTTAQAPAGAPNVVMILLDDLGFGQFGCFGSDIATPNIDRLARGGLRYNRFHVTALCSPTRAALLTGRNHHSVGMGFLCDVPTDDPGYTGKIPPTAAALPRVLRDAGWNTMAVGKWHLTPSGERSAAGPYDRWPLGLGFERYYGFLRGDANHWAPELVRDNSYVEPPCGPDEGYHLTEDLTDEAIRMVVGQQQSAPGKPFFLYFAPGAMHAPHHVERSWADAYSGRFDLGWDRWREQVFARQLAEGVVPSGTTLTERPSWVPAWDDLTDDERRLYARMHEVYAGFLTHTDAQIGRLLDALDDLGVTDDTLIMVMSDNGASAEGGVAGTFNEHRFTHRIRDDLADSLERLDDWGGVDGYPHYAWGWAWAGNTPFRLWKRYTWLGGTRVPLVVHWPSRIADPGRVRTQFAHAVDIAPTILDACGVTAPDHVGGVPQQPVDGASLLPTFVDAVAAAPRTGQYFEMLGSRSIVGDGWKATTDHVSAGVLDEELLMTGSRDFADDRWSLFRMDDDFSEAHDVADAHPDVVRDLEARWELEADRHGVRPLADSLVGRVVRLTPRPYAPGVSVTLRPAGGPVSDEVLPRLHGGGTLRATIDVPDGAGNGVLFALGDHNGGFAAYVVEGVASLTIASAGGEVTVTAPGKLDAGRHQLAWRLAPRSDGGLGITYSVDDVPLVEADSPHALPHAWQHGGTSLTLGRDRGLPVSDRYRPPFPWTGVLHDVTVESGISTPLDAEDVRIALQVE